MKGNKEKSEKLEEKIDKLVEKIENEKSKTKRLAYIIKCKMLINKLEREIDLNKVKEAYEASKERNNITAKEVKVVIRKNIIKINQRLQKLERDLKANRRYNHASADFMFSEEDVKDSGGIYHYAMELEESGEQETAEKLMEVEDKRREAERLKKQLEVQKEILGEVDNKLRKANNTFSRAETMVTAKSRFNIFAKIRNLASSIVYGAKEFITEAKENRQTNKVKVAEFEKLQSDYEARKEEIRKEYDTKMEELKEAYYKKDGNNTNKWEKRKEEKNKTRRKGQAAKFQEDLQNMAESENREVNSPDMEEAEENREAAEHDEQDRSAVEGQNQDREEVEVLEGDVVNTEEIEL